MVDPLFEGLVEGFMFLNKKLSNSKGFSLVSVMVASALGVITMMVMAQQFLAMNRMQMKWNAMTAMMTYRNILKATVESEVSWVNTLNDPGNINLACLRGNRDCRGAGGPLILRTASNSVFYNSINTDNGLTSNMVNCVGFTQNQTENLSCPFRLNLTWEAMCPPIALGGGCQDPLIRIRGTWSYTGVQFMGGLNLDRYKIDFIKTRQFQNVKQAVSESLSRLGQCPPNQAVISFNSGGWVCQNFQSGTK